MNRHSASRGGEVTGGIQEHVVRCNRNAILLFFLALLLPVNAVQGFMPSNDVHQTRRSSLANAIGADAGESSYNLFDKKSKLGKLGFVPESVENAAVADASTDAGRSATDTSMTPFNAARATTTAIHATISDMFEQACRSAAVGILGETTETTEIRTPYPGTILAYPRGSSGTSKASDRLTVRVATKDDDVDIANLRLSVFSDFSPEVRKSFCARSCHVLETRRNQGATCLVSTVPRYGSVLSTRPDIILGSLEVSFHEFHGTTLGRRRLQSSVLYVTEVAVSPTARRKGVATKMMKALDELASIRGAETVYLHVEANNMSAMNLYKSVGYVFADDYDPMFQEFTKRLQLHEESPLGRKHYLMYKNLRKPTWLPFRTSTIDAMSKTLGFEVPP